MLLSPQAPAISSKDGRFQAALDCIAAAHSQEVCGLHEENQHLRYQLTQLKEQLKTTQASTICATIDEPKMHSVAMSVAEDMADWIGSGGPDEVIWAEAKADEAALKGRPAEAREKAMEICVVEKHKDNSVRDEGREAVEVHVVEIQKDHNSVRNDNGEVEKPKNSSGMQDERGEVAEKNKSFKDVREENEVASVWRQQVQLPRDSATEACGIVGPATLPKADEDRGVQDKLSIEKVPGAPNRSQSMFEVICVSTEGRNLAEKTIESRRALRNSLVDREKRRQMLVDNTIIAPGVTDAVEAIHSIRTSACSRYLLWCQGGARRLVKHPVFDFLCAIMIVSNSALIGVVTQHTATYEDETPVMIGLGHFCSGFFLVELILRVFSEGQRFVTSTEGRVWNMLDFVLVAFSLVELILTMGSSKNTIGSAVKTLKILRILRLIRVFRFWKDLALLALMVIDSMKSLFNALGMLVIITYVFAVMFTGLASVHIRDTERVGGQVNPDLMRHFGDLWESCYALCQAMLGGISWGVLSDALRDINEFAMFLFIFYVFFTMLAVLNIITGVFVDNAVETARTQRDFMVQKELELKEMYVKEMKKLFDQIDEDNSHTVNLDEVQRYFEDPHVSSYFQALGLDPHDSERLFELLDSDHSGDVGIDEFIEGCLRLKGQARSIDIYALTIQNNRMEENLKKLADAFDSGMLPHRSTQDDLVVAEVRPGSVRGRAIHASQGLPRP